MLSRFTNKPKWQHRDPDMRKVAIEELEDGATLNEIAQNDEAASVRRAAVRKIDDLDVLYTIFHQDEDDSVRELAEQRFKQLLCGQKETCPPLEKRLAWLDNNADSELLEYLALNGQESALRLRAITRIQREGLLGDIAINDPDSEIRLAAAERLSQRSTLERVFKAIRNRDKYVSRIVRDKLDKLIEQIERPFRVRTECEAICKQLDALTYDMLTTAKFSTTRLPETWESTHAEFKRLQERWQKVGEEAEEPFKERFTKAENLLLERYHAFQQEQALIQQREQALLPIRAVKQTLCKEAEALQTEVHALEHMTDKEADQFCHRLSVLQSEWVNAQPLDTAEEREWQTRFTQLYQTTKNHYQVLRDSSQTVNALEALCRDMENLLERKETVKSSQFKRFQEQWQAVAQPPKPSALVIELNNRYRQAIQVLLARLQVQMGQQEEALNTVKRLIQQIETKLDIGELHAAIPLEQEARELLKVLPSISSSRLKTLENRLQHSSFKIRELRSWERWGDNRERENLCLQMEALINRIDDNPEETARLIREAQLAWKRLGTTGHSQKLWERFNHACNAAYKPCKTFFDKKAQERENNYQERQKLCEQLETLGKTTDWKSPNWKEIYQAIREAEKAWHAVGTVNRKARKDVKKRFDNAMDVLDAHLEEERKRNFQQRGQLIEKVKVVQTLKDLPKAIEEAKKLQAKWQITIPSSRREEHRLWEEFRTACDVVFERRKEQRDEVKREYQTNLDRRSALCEQVEALMQLTGEESKSAVGQIKKLQMEWRELAPPPKKSADAVEKRFATACQQVLKRHQDQIIAGQRQQLDLLGQKALLCTELEQLIGNSLENENQVARVQQQWESLPLLTDVKLEKSITQRFEHAKQRVWSGQPNFSEDVIKARKLLCIRLEILAEIESPAEAVEERLAYQVSRLSEALSGGDVGSTDKMTEVQEIERSWYLAGALPPEQSSVLYQRFDRAYRAFYGV